uniref:Glutathione-disulfide reductase n=1 Tax=Aquila chrysaetos chrysaetos TaxID=223781 RepID=A0A663FCH2_AQUCH
MAAAAYELLVLGGGSGGLAGARRAAELGARVALVEPRRFGGTCVNVGCVPKKVMWNTAVHAEFIHDHADYGFETPSVKFNWRTIKEKRDAYVRRLNEIYENNVKKAHIDIIRGYGKFTADPEPTIEVNGKKYTAPHILIATGGRPAVPPDSKIPGASLGMTSDGFFDLEELPRRSVIVGAGYIAVEIVGILSTLGSKSSLLIRQDKVLRTFDSMISSNCTQELENTGVDVWKHTQVRARRAAPWLVPSLPERQGRGKSRHFGRHSPSHGFGGITGFAEGKSHRHLLPRRLLLFPAGQNGHQVLLRATGCDGDLLGAWPQADGGSDPGRGLPALGRGAGAQHRGPVPGPSGETVAHPFRAECKDARGSPGIPRISGACHGVAFPPCPAPRWEYDGHRHGSPVGIACPVPPGARAEAAAVSRGRACRWTPRATWWWTSTRTPPGEGSTPSGTSAGEPSSPQVPRPCRPPLHRPSVPRRAAAHVHHPSPQWPSQLAESWPTGSLRASGSPGWTTITSPPSSSATRPSAPWVSPKVGTERTRGGGGEEVGDTVAQGCRFDA